MWYLCVISALHCWEEGPGLTIQGILAQGGAQVALYPQWDLVCSVLLRVPPHPRSSPVILGKVLGRGPGWGGSLCSLSVRWHNIYLSGHNIYLSGMSDC